MNPQAKLKPDDTRARIMESAETLFRRLGFAKTTVADIAAELGMSPANVYRFFPSKAAIVEAICQRHLATIENDAWAIARARGVPENTNSQSCALVFGVHSIFQASASPRKSNSPTRSSQTAACNSTSR